MSDKIVSADSHVIEPPDLWLERIDRRYRERAPRVVKAEGATAHFFVAEGVERFPVAVMFATGAGGQELADYLSKGYESARPGGWDPVERIKDQDADGVAAEVLYTSMGMPLFRMPDGELQAACFKAYNDWLAEFTSHDRKRLLPIALIPLANVEEGVKELQRCVRAGFRAAQIAASPPAGRNYHDPAYDPFWGAAQELGVPLSLHVATGRPEFVPTWETVLIGYVLPIHEIQLTIASFVFGGVLERFPRLKLVSAENDAGWLPHFIYRLDHGYEKYGTMWRPGTLSLKPSDYVRRQIWATFQTDYVAPMTYSYFGEDRYMWASDFPHSDSTWPNSRAVIAHDFGGVPQSVTRKIVCDNAAALYGIEV